MFDWQLHPGIALRSTIDLENKLARNPIALFAASVSTIHAREKSSESHEATGIGVAGEIEAKSATAPRLEMRRVDCGGLLKERTVRLLRPQAPCSVPYIEE